MGRREVLEPEKKRRRSESFDPRKEYGTQKYAATKRQKWSPRSRSRSEEMLRLRGGAPEEEEEEEEEEEGPEQQRRDFYIKQIKELLKRFKHIEDVQHSGEYLYDDNTTFSVIIERMLEHGRIDQAAIFLGRGVNDMIKDDETIADKRQLGEAQRILEKITKIGKQIANFSKAPAAAPVQARVGAEIPTSTSKYFYRKKEFPGRFTKNKTEKTKALYASFPRQVDIVPDDAAAIFEKYGVRANNPSELFLVLSRDNKLLDHLQTYFNILLIMQKNGFNLKEVLNAPYITARENEDLGEGSILPVYDPDVHESREEYNKEFGRKKKQGPRATSWEGKNIIQSIQRSVNTKTEKEKRHKCRLVKMVYCI